MSNILGQARSVMGANRADAPHMLSIMFVKDMPFPEHSITWKYKEIKYYMEGKATPTSA
jgi:hypothetical protein